MVEVGIERSDPKAEYKKVIDNFLLRDLRNYIKLLSYL